MILDAAKDHFYTSTPRRGPSPDRDAESRQEGPSPGPGPASAGPKGRSSGSVDEYQGGRNIQGGTTHSGSHSGSGKILSAGKRRQSASSGGVKTTVFEPHKAARFSESKPTESGVSATSSEPLCGQGETSSPLSEGVSSYPTLAEVSSTALGKMYATLMLRIKTSKSSSLEGELRGKDLRRAKEPKAGTLCFVSP